MTDASSSRPRALGLVQYAWEPLGAEPDADSSEVLNPGNRQLLRQLGRKNLLPPIHQQQVDSSQHTPSPLSSGRFLARQDARVVHRRVEREVDGSDDAVAVLFPESAWDDNKSSLAQQVVRAAKDMLLQQVQGTSNTAVEQFQSDQICNYAETTGPRSPAAKDTAGLQALDNADAAQQLINCTTWLTDTASLLPPFTPTSSSTPTPLTTLVLDMPGGQCSLTPGSSCKLSPVCSSLVPPTEATNPTSNTSTERSSDADTSGRSLRRTSAFSERSSKASVDILSSSSTAERSTRVSRSSNTSSVAGLIQILASKDSSAKATHNVSLEAVAWQAGHKLTLWQQAKAVMKKLIQTKKTQVKLQP